MSWEDIKWLLRFWIVFYCAIDGNCEYESGTGWVAGEVQL